MFQGPNIVIHQPDSVLNSMGEWCTQHHGQVDSVFLSELFVFTVKVSPQRLQNDTPLLFFAF